VPESTVETMTAPCEPIETATTQLEPSTYITANQVAALVGCDTATVYRWASTYLDMPVLRIGGVVRFHRERLLDWLQAQEQASRAQRRAQSRQNARK
jgi:excisionase family DNA binding protein